MATQSEAAGCSYTLTSTSSLQGSSIPQESAESIARRYQIDFLEKAKEGNIIACLDTGCGKTLISILLLKAFSNLFAIPQQNVSVFLVPTVNLVHQQANMIEYFSNLKVGQYTGQSDKDRWHLQKWEEDTCNLEVLVMTPQILLNILRHSLIRWKTIKVLIFDECHHCQKDHPYAQIMEEFYFTSDHANRPRVFGMTASPIIRKGKSDLQFIQDITALECLLDSKICSVKDDTEIKEFVPSPKVECKEYDRTYNSFDILQGHGDMLHDLMIKHSRQSLCKHSNEENVELLKQRHKTFAKICRDLDYCIFELGLWCARQAVTNFLCVGEGTVGHTSEESGEEIPNFDKELFLQEIHDSLAQMIPEGFGDLTMDSVKPDVVSSKVALLVDVLSNYRRTNLKCIIFVERVIAAKVLASLLCQCFKDLGCKFIVGSNARMSNASRSVMHQTLLDFRSGMLNVLVATNVAEEGLDIQDCCLVIQFDLPKTLRSFIQARGRARSPGSKYVILKERGNLNDEELLASLIGSEALMKEQILHGVDVPLKMNDWDQKHKMHNFQVEATGAIVNLHSSVELLHHFCSKLPGDKFYQPTPDFSFISDAEGIKCKILLPSNAPIRMVVGDICDSKGPAKKMACLKAIRVLHSIGSLNDHLLPQTGTMDNEKDAHNYEQATKQTSPGCDAELQEAVTPSVLLRKNVCNSSLLCLQAYKLGFVAVPSDRKYTNFALFIQSSLHTDAANISVNLQLGGGRTVTCDFTALGEVLFDQFQVMQSEKFQSALFSILLDRAFDSPKQFVTDDKWYLLLPLRKTVDLKDSQDLQIDWSTINKIIQKRDDQMSGNETRAVCPDSSDALYFADGLVEAKDIAGSLVETVYNSNFYCVIEIIPDQNCNSSFPDPSYNSYADYFRSSHSVEILNREQPLLRVKPLRHAHNLLMDRSSKKTGPDGSKQMLLELPAELCRIKIFGLHDGLINAAALLPSFMHRLERILIAIQLRDVLTAKFSEGSRVSVDKVLEALTTQKCMEQFSLERLELLGDSFLKYAVSCHLFLTHDKADEGFLSLQRVHRINNAALYVLGKRHGLHAYIHDTWFRPEHWIAPFHPSKVICDEGNLASLHGESFENNLESNLIICNKRHQWIQRKTVADVVEALIGAYLVDGGRTAALAFMDCIGLTGSINPAQIASIHTSSEKNLSISTIFDVEAVEKLISYRFRHKGLLIEAFTHASFNKHLGGCYQRLEFLGDSVLDYLITQYLYEKYDSLKPGKLTDLKSAAVNNESFARVAVLNKLYIHLIENSTHLSQQIKTFVSNICDSAALKRESSGSWNCRKCPKVLGDIVESLAAAILVDSEFDLDVVWNVFHPLLQTVVTVDDCLLHPVRELQELCQRNRFHLKLIPSEQNCSEFGYRIEVQLKNAIIVGAATAKDKKSAKRQAAHHTLWQLQDLGYTHGQKSLIAFLDSSKGKKVDPVEEKTGACQKPVRATQEKFILEGDFSGCGESSGKKNFSVIFHPADPKLQVGSNFDSSIEPNFDHEQDIIVDDLSKNKSQELHYKQKITKKEDIGRDTLPCRFELEVTVDIPASTLLPYINAANVSSAQSTNQEHPRLQRPGGKIESERQFHQLAVVNPDHNNEAAESDAITLCNRQMKVNSNSSEANSMAAILTKTAQNEQSRWQRQETATDLERLLQQFSLLDAKSTLQSAEPWIKDPCIRTERSNSSLSEANSGASELSNAENWTQLGLEKHGKTNDFERLLHQLALPKQKNIMQSKQSNGVNIANRRMKSDCSSSKTYGENLAIHNDCSVELLNTKRVTALRPDQGGLGELLSGPLESRILTVDSSNEKRKGRALSPYGHNGFPNQVNELNFECSKGTARSMLYEACARNGWKDPIFVSRKGDGMDHHKMFTYDILVQCPERHLECSGEPRKSKRAAMDSAAEDLLRCLKSQGYI